MNLVVVVVWSICVVQLVAHVLVLLLWDHWKLVAPVEFLEEVNQGELKSVALKSTVDQEGVEVFLQEVSIVILELVTVVVDLVAKDYVLSQVAQLVDHVGLDLQRFLVGVLNLAYSSVICVFAFFFVVFRGGGLAARVVMVLKIVIGNDEDAPIKVVNGV